MSNSAKEKFGKALFVLLFVFIVCVGPLMVIAGKHKHVEQEAAAQSAKALEAHKTEQVSTKPVEEEEVPDKSPIADGDLVYYTIGELPANNAKAEPGTQWNYIRFGYWGQKASPSQPAVRVETIDHDFAVIVWMEWRRDTEQWTLLRATVPMKWLKKPPKLVPKKVEG
jgi:hypothetical protein